MGLVLAVGSIVSFGAALYYAIQGGDIKSSLATYFNIYFVVLICMNFIQAFLNGAYNDGQNRLGGHDTVKEALLGAAILCIFPLLALLGLSGGLTVHWVYNLLLLITALVSLMGASLTPDPPAGEGIQHLCVAHGLTYLFWVLALVYLLVARIVGLF